MRADQGMNILVTGARGFIGGFLCSALKQSGHRITEVKHKPGGGWVLPVGSFDVLIHLAAKNSNPGNASIFSEYYEINTVFTERLALEAAHRKVKRLIFLSTARVSLLESVEPLFPPCSGRQTDPYSLSKLKAEQALKLVAERTGLPLVIVRPPIVHGPGVRGNFERLMNLINRGLPLPLGAVNNKRSVVGVDNLVDFLIRCVEAPYINGHTLTVRDDEDLSTPELIQRMARAMDRRAILWRIPLDWLKFSSKFFHRTNEINRLIESLVVDDSRSRELLRWKPKLSLDEGLSRMAIGERGQSMAV